MHICCTRRKQDTYNINSIWGYFENVTEELLNSSIDISNTLEKDKKENDFR